MLIVTDTLATQQGASVDPELLAELQQLAAEVEASLVEAMHQQAAQLTLVERLEVQLAAATAQLQAAEAKLAAVPVAAIRRCWGKEYYDDNEWAGDCNLVQSWLDTVQEVQP